MNKDGIIVAATFLITFFMLLVAIAAYDIRENAVQIKMTEKGYCWELTPFSGTLRSWRPCSVPTSKVTVEESK